MSNRRMRDMGIDEFIESAQDFIRGQKTMGDNLRLQGVLSALERAEKTPSTGLLVDTGDGLGFILSERDGEFTILGEESVWRTDRVDDVGPEVAKVYSQEVMREALLSRMNRHNGLPINHSALEGVSLLLRHSKSLGQNVLTLGCGNLHTWAWDFEGNSHEVEVSDLEPAVIDVENSQPYVGSYWPDPSNMELSVGPGSLLVNDYGEEVAIRMYEGKIQAVVDDGKEVSVTPIRDLGCGVTVKRWYPKEGE